MRSQACLQSTLSQGVPARPLLSKLPLARVNPQDLHSVLDYIDAATVLSGALLTRCSAIARRRARPAWQSAAAASAWSAITDYRLSLAKELPIEAHQVVD